MNDRSAERVANVVLFVAASAAAFYILKTPSLRRAAFRFAAVALTGSIPAWFRQEIEAGWRQSGG